MYDLCIYVLVNEHVLHSFLLYLLQLTETAGTIEGISSEIASLIAECVWVRRDEVKAELVRQACSISSCDLEDYDWDTKVGVASLPCQLWRSNNL